MLHTRFKAESPVLKVGSCHGTQLKVTGLSALSRKPNLDKLGSGGGARGHGEACRTVARHSGAAQAAAEIRDAQAFPHRWGQPLSAGSAGIHSGLYRNAGGERRSFDRGPTSQPGTERQWVADTDGGQSAAGMWPATRTSECR